MKYQRYILPEPPRAPAASRARRRPFPTHYLKHLFWIVPLILADILIFGWFKHREKPIAEAAEEIASEPATTTQETTISTPWKKFVYPTEQTRLLEGVTADIFQPTASGNPESGLYGSVRTANHGRGLISSFHEGIDIAAKQRDRHGRPLDTAHAVADGVVGYVNRVAGNSNYGIYVVLLHPDPIGDVYTLYAHLAEVPKTLRAGQKVSAGETIGVMGNTSSGGIPMARAHLHFEIGLINNRQFASWYRAQKLKPDHGNFHGRNFLGINPLKFMAHLQQDPNLDFRSHLATLPPAFDVVLAGGRLPDILRRYPSLWSGPAFDGSPLVLSCSDNGTPLSGRRATGAEQEALGKQKCAVLHVDEAVLGRNGAHLVSKTSQGWVLGRQGEEWLEILTY